LGGIGQVWVARDAELDREVALKELRPERASDPSMVARFLREARVTGRLEHPGIAPVYEMATGADGEPPFYTMRFVHGRTLTEAVQDYHRGRAEGRIGTSGLIQLLNAFVSVCNTVAYAHTRGVVHRDLKGQNVVLGDFGETIVLDWGFAKILGQEPEDNERESTPHPGCSPTEAVLPNACAAFPKACPLAPESCPLTPDACPLSPGSCHLSPDPADHTQAGQLLGTPAYMSPEQAEGRLDRIDFRTDVFGLGAILYEILAGRPPFVGENTAEVLRRARAGQVPPPQAVAAGVPRALAAVCTKAMARRPGDRYQSATDLARDIQHWLADEPLQGCREPWWDRGQRWARHHKAMLLVLTAVSVFGGLALALLSEARSRLAQTEAETTTYHAKLRAAADAEIQRQLRVQLYFHSVALAERELHADNLGRASELLADCPPELRGWEWHLLARKCRTPQRVLRGHTAAVSAVAFSPDGKLLVSASHDNTLKVWDVLQGRELFTLTGHQDAAYDVAMSPEGHLAASAGWDGFVRIWDLTLRKEIGRFEKHHNIVHRLAFSPDGRRIASLGSDNRVLVWRVTDQEVLAIFEAAKGQHLYRVAFSPDGSYLAITSTRGVELWDPATNKVIQMLSGPSEYIKCVAFSPSGRLLATGEGDLAYGDPGRVRIWDIARAEVLYTLEGHTEPIFALVFSPDGSRLFSASQDHTVKVWDLTKQREALTLWAHEDTVRGLALSPDGYRLASAGADGTIQLWNATPGEAVLEPDLLHSLDGHTEAVFGVVFNAAGSRLASLSLDGILKIWDTASGSEIASYNPLAGAMPRCFALALAPKGQEFALSSTDGKVYLVNAATGRLEKVLSLHIPGPIKGLAFSPDGKRLASAGWDRTVCISPLDGGEALILRGHTEAVLGVAFSPDGQLVASAGYDTTVRIWDAATGELLQILPGHTSRVHGVAFSHNGNWLASAGNDGVIRVWETSGWTLKSKLRGHASGVSAVAFSPDDRYVASAGHDHMVRVWDVAAGEEIATYRGHADRIHALAFSADGKRLASGGHDRSVKLWAFTRPVAQP
jgi:WD40 repeat protein/serine/threonine protein kinase